MNKSKQNPVAVAMNKRHNKNTKMKDKREKRKNNPRKTWLDECNNYVYGRDKDV